jgi:hypothetical protein
MLEYQGLWDLFSGPALLGESREDAALRFLARKAGIVTEGPLVPAAVASDYDGSLAHRTLFVFRLVGNMRPFAEKQTFMEVDADELDGLVRDMPELLAPSLLWAVQTGKLCSP